MVTKVEFEEGLKEYVGHNQTYWFIDEIGFPVTNGVKYVLETLNAWFILVFIYKVLNNESLMAHKITQWGKSLFIMEVTEKGCLLTLHYDDEELARMEVNDRPDLPQVRVVMVFGHKVVYLLNED